MPSFTHGLQSQPIMTVICFLRYLALWNCVILRVYAVNLYPPAYVKLNEGEVVTIVPPNPSPTQPADPQSTGGISTKVYGSSHGCAKNVARGCPGVALVAVGGYKPTVNGCGPDTNDKLVAMFNRVINTDWAEPCCNAHDLCFGACDSDFDQCNTNFANCLTNQCTSRDANCAAMVPAYIGAVSSIIGCDVFTTPNPGCACPPIAYNTTQSGHYQQYFWILDQYTPKTLRSLNSDTNTILIGVDINGVPSYGGELRKYQGNQGSGHKSSPGMEIDFWAFDTDQITLWVSIYNGDLSPTSIDSLRQSVEKWSPGGILNLLAQGTEAVVLSGLNFLGNMYRGVLGGFLPHEIYSFFTEDCDGWVVQRTISLKGSQMAPGNQPQTTQTSSDGGYESPSGCGDKSVYDVTTRFGLKQLGGLIDVVPDHPLTPIQTQVARPRSHHLKY